MQTLLYCVCFVRKALSKRLPESAEQPFRQNRVSVCMLGKCVMVHSWLKDSSWWVAMNHSSFLPLEVDFQACVLYSLYVGQGHRVCKLTLIDRKSVKAFFIGLAVHHTSLSGSFPTVHRGPPVQPLFFLLFKWTNQQVSTLLHTWKLVKIHINANKISTSNCQTAYRSTNIQNRHN